MQHAVLLGRDSWMRFNNRIYRSLPPRPSGHRIFGELELSRHAPAGVRAYVVNPVLRVDDSTFVTMAPKASLCPTN